MAKPVPFHVLPRDPVEALRSRLDTAPAEHAAAVLAAYDLLQELHDRGVLGLIRTGLATSDQLLETLVGGLDTPESVRVLRNLLLLKSALGRIEPEALQRILRATADSLPAATIAPGEPVSLWAIVRRAFNQDTRRGLMAAIGFIEGLGRRLDTPAPALQPPGSGRAG